MSAHNPPTWYACAVDGIMRKAAQRNCCFMLFSWKGPEGRTLIDYGSAAKGRVIGNRFSRNRFSRTPPITCSLATQGGGVHASPTARRNFFKIKPVVSVKFDMPLHGIDPRPARRLSKHLRHQGGTCEQQTCGAILCAQ